MPGFANGNGGRGGDAVASCGGCSLASKSCYAVAIGGQGGHGGTASAVTVPSATSGIFWAMATAGSGGNGGYGVNIRCSIGGAPAGTGGAAGTATTYNLCG